MNRATKRCRELLVGVASCLCVATAMAQPRACSAPAESNKGPYSAACAGRSECSVTDRLEIKPLTGAKPVLRVCLLLDRRDGTATYRLAEWSKPGDATASTYSLASAARDWAGDEKLDKVMRESPNAKLDARVFVRDADDKEYVDDIVIDIAPLWVDRTLPLRIDKVQCPAAAAGGEEASAARCTFASEVRLSVPALGAWSLATKSNAKKLALVLGGVRLPGIEPEVSTEPGKGWLGYRLKRDAENADAWAAILERALGGHPAFEVGLADDKGVLAEAGSEAGQGRIAFAVPPPQRRAFATLLFLFGTVVVAFAFGVSSGWTWLRDGYGIPDDVVPLKERSFSLGRCQMLWWAVVVLVSWFAILYATGDGLSFRESTLVLLGISAGTAVAAYAVTPDKVATRVKVYEDAVDAQRAAPNDPAADAQLAAAKAAIASLPGIRSTRSFWRDLACDFGQDTGLHRVQMIVFTLAFGVYFGWQAFHTGAMPELPATVLALIGVSSTGYVGFKYAAA